MLKHILSMCCICAQHGSRVILTAGAFKRGGPSGRYNGRLNNDFLKSGVFSSVVTNAPFVDRVVKGVETSFYIKRVCRYLGNLIMGSIHYRVFCHSTLGRVLIGCLYHTTNAQACQLKPVFSILCSYICHHMFGKPFPNFPPKYAR